MNRDYIEKQLIGQAVPDNIKEDTLYFLTSYGWRKSPRGNVYIIGLEKGTWDYYWVCYTEKKTIVFISCCCKIDHNVIENTELRLNDEDIEIIRNEIKDLVIKGKRNFPVCMFTGVPELEYYPDLKYNPNVSWVASSASKSKVKVKKLSSSDENYKVSLDPDILAKVSKLTVDPEAPIRSRTLRKNMGTGNRAWDEEDMKIEESSLTEEQKKELMQYAMDKLNQTKPLSFNLTKLETLRYNNFCEKHCKCVNGKIGAIGSGVSLKITGTGLGWCYECICNGCGTIESITDTNEW